MLQNIFKNLWLIAFVLLLQSCKDNNAIQENKPKTEKIEENEPSPDGFNLIRGKFEWNFKIVLSKQKSIHTFYKDKIEYEMKGLIHSTKYTMTKISYDKNEKRWIGKDKNNTIYVLFFKDIKNNSVVIYKTKFKGENALEKAKEFEYPAPDDTRNHGWNMYSRDGKSVDDPILFEGEYHSKDHKLIVSKDKLILDGKSYQKLSYHKGERRWVGKLDNNYLQLFFKPFNNNYKEIYIDIQYHKDLEKTYKTKYDETKKFIKFTKK